MRYLVMFMTFALVFLGCQNYDALITADQFCQQKWADYEADLQRRADLIPNITATVQSEAGFEKDTLTAVTQARAAATSVQLKADDFSDPAKVAAFNQAQNQLHGSLARLMVASERYPDLKANAAFHDLRVQLEGTENRILRSRQEYNKAVSAFNTELGKIHGQVTNAVTGHPFQPRIYFEADASAKAAPNVASMLAPTPAAPVAAAAAALAPVATPLSQVTPAPQVIVVQTPAPLPYPVTLASQPASQAVQPPQAQPAAQQAGQSLPAPAPSH